MSEKTLNNLLEADIALGSFLDDMLHEATLAKEVRPALCLARSGRNLVPEILLCDDAVDPVVAKSSTQVADVEAEPVNQQDEDVAVSTELSAELFPLQCLMFKVADNLLSVPLIEIRGVVNWQDKLTRIPQEPDWILGILQYREQNIRVVDCASILQIRNGGDASSGHILILGDDEWGLTCDQVDKVVTLEYDDIQWNQSSSNSLIYGAIRESLASLINPQGIVQTLWAGRDQKGV
ncbi:MAG: chemotaxis protein CheW [Gammaproteobacteria bacterium]|nr:chemotaxis protein CheW [Gammaproteobacteria bacterium]